MAMKKVVPAANPDAYVAALRGWRREVVEMLREATRKAAKLEEVIKWGHIVYFANGPVLLRVSDSPVVVLNHAIAAAAVHGARAGLALLAPLDAHERLREHHRLAAVRAHLLERAGDVADAEAPYRLAATNTSISP